MLVFIEDGYDYLVQAMLARPNEDCLGDVVCTGKAMNFRHYLAEYANYVDRNMYWAKTHIVVDEMYETLNGYTVSGELLGLKFYLRLYNNVNHLLIAELKAAVFASR